MEENNKKVIIEYLKQFGSNPSDALIKRTFLSCYYTDNEKNLTDKEKDKIIDKATKLEKQYTDNDKKITVMKRLVNEEIKNPSKLLIEWFKINIFEYALAENDKEEDIACDKLYKLEEKFSKEDWENLIKQAGSNQARYNYKKKMEKYLNMNS